LKSIKLKITDIVIILAIVGISVCITYFVAQTFDLSKEVERLATENEQMRFADERMERSRTNFQSPGITPEEIQWLHTISADYGVPYPLLYAMRRTENGGRGLYMGAANIDPEIRLKYPPLWWQFAQAAKIWNQHLNAISMSDPYIQRRVLWDFAKQWNIEPISWTEGVEHWLEICQDNNAKVFESVPIKVRFKKRASGKALKHSHRQKHRSPE
jgi:hypothetical protein